ncbi:hypothetical protein [Saccharopolyspora rosea]|uniref:Uncharacterized protein n=1 Tax=Saccharopolyspora rosea TaxID=524884 RepID=A0ABW3FQG5_9PSEU|nr:hypothetical protein [Saccharopolyspora rosea]
MGELPLDEVAAPARPAARPAPPRWEDGPERIEVTQPYIPAIRDEQPEFAKRLNPEPPTAPTPASTPADETGPRPAEPRVGAESPEPTLLTQPQAPVAPRPAEQARPAAPVKKRSIFRRVVRRIIGPDLLRKDPPPKKR